MSHDPRALVVEICSLLAAREFTTATGGNVSLRLPDNTFWVTPSMLHKARVGDADLVRVDIDGHILEGTRRPSSEIFMHLAAYKALPQAGGIIHAHPPYGTAVAQTGRTLDTSANAEALVVLGRKVPLIPYAHAGSSELAAVVGGAMQPLHKAYVMAHHGVITWGTDLWEAYDILDTLELCARSIALAALFGGAQALPESTLEALEEKHKVWIG